MENLIKLEFSSIPTVKKKQSLPWIIASLGVILIWKAIQDKKQYKVAPLNKGND